MRTRNERRENTKQKWFSRLRKFWESGTFFEKVRKVKSDKSIKYKNLPKAESWDGFKEDRFGVMLKNTGTITYNKMLTEQQVHKIRVKDKTLDGVDKEELNDVIEDFNTINLDTINNCCDSCGDESDESDE